MLKECKIGLCHLPVRVRRVELIRQLVGGLDTLRDVAPDQTFGVRRHRGGAGVGV